MNKTLLIIGLSAAITSTSSFAATYPDFTVQEGFVTGTPSNVFTADKITGNYVETAIFTPTSALAGTFTLSLLWDAGQFVGVDGTVPQSSVGDTYLGAPGATGYGMYANLNGSGTYGTVLGAIVSGYQTSITTFTFAAGGSLALFLDADKNKATLADRVQIAQGAFLGGSGTLDTTKTECDNPNTPNNEGNNCGSFSANTSFQLINGGQNFFTAPVPFYNLAFGSGQLNNFAVSGTQTINGSMDVTFEGKVPEPASLALLGIGILGLGASRRKQA